MILSQFLFSTLIACGEKSNDTQSTEDTGSTQDTGEVVDTSSPIDTGTEPTDTGEEPTDSGEIPNETWDGQNNSEPAPEGSCMENSLQILTPNDSYNITSFIWEMEIAEEGPRVFLAGYNSGTVDVCGGLDTDDPLNYAQINVTANPNLSDLPQTIGLGVFDYSQNISGQVTFLTAPASGVPDIFVSLAGEAKLNSFIEEEKALMSELRVGQMGVEKEDFSGYDPVDVQFSNGTNIIACHCEGLIEYYNGLDPEFGSEPEEEEVDEE